MNSVGKKLKELREARLSQDEMAQLSGVPRTTIQRIEAGKSHDYRDIEAITKVLGTTPAALWEAPAPAPALSADFALNPTAADAAAVLAEFLRASPGRRSFAMSILFDDSSLAKEADRQTMLPSVVSPRASKGS